MNPDATTSTSRFRLLDERPDFRADWRHLVLLAAAGFLVTLAVRLLEAPAWNSPAFMVQGERILSTHDAYCWLAGAKGIGEYAHFGMAALARLLASVSGQPLWSVAFWTPPVLGSLTAVATGLWGWLLAGRRAAILPGLIGALAPAYAYRTRLGYFDSDPFTLLMPLLLALFLALLLRPCLPQQWLPNEEERTAPPAMPAAMPWLALGFGLLARVAHFAHDDIHALGVGLLWLALALGAALALPGRRAALLRLLAIYALAAYAGPRRFGAEVFQLGLSDLPGLGLAATAAWLAARKPAALARWNDSPWAWLAAFAALAAVCGLLLPVDALWTKALSYFKPFSDSGLPRLASGEDPPSYPGITQSIREARNVADLALFFDGTSFSQAGGAAGLLGMAFLLSRRPLFILLLPLAVLAFASLRMGTRFAMFGGPLFALGLGTGAYWLTSALVLRLGLSPRWPVRIQAALAALIVLASYAPRYAETRPTPVLTAPHAQALLSLRQDTPPDARLWTWWDYGYAAQYFAERATPIDGGRHAGRDVFPTALALTTDSFRQAARVILLSAGLPGTPGRADGLVRRWDAMPALAVRHDISALRNDGRPVPACPPQYLLVSWENIPLLYWISFYGSWDVVGGGGRHASVMQVAEALNVDTRTGMLKVKSRRKPLPLASAQVLGAGGPRPIGIPPRKDGAHLLINEANRQALLLDDMAYNSMAVQLLVGDPTRPEQSRYFKLLHEGFPLVRIYQVLPGPNGVNGQAKVSPQ
ncbi:dolichyl-diphosphooligosaccharide--protein glycosyltransferase [Humidesulfovibrio mexicanus]|uniref:Dolichyl-diphosphooligosaccharide--protein glycosyltransferase n=1 Tax=Humidesulfovibrio mexicanus TaxID=147047 RepID=A0A239BSR3_9BACT|nr:STT3 domain-containing protein [Humidesulfovibrio mexicanus]SNS11057.1 dolichyl-diphosphooligosaccharide--protein glycosyltransferase [Humidesulfovibrio mexicanus]